MKSFPKYQIVQEFLNGKLSPFLISKKISTFKYKYDFKILSQVLPDIFRINQRFRKLIWGNIFPKTVEELGGANHFYFKAEKVDSEINWVMAQVLLNKESIRLFVKKRDTVFNNILLGNYEIAEKELESVRKEFGFSVWYYEMRILIYSLTGKESKIFDILDNINNKFKESNNKGKTGFVPILLYFFYLRSSEKSVSNFDNELNNLSNKNRNYSHLERFNYLKHRLNYYATIDEVERQSVLVYEAPNALVDRYETLLSVLLSIFLKEEDKRMLVSSFAYKLYKVVKDTQLLSIIAFDPNINLPKDYYSNSLIEIVNNYYGKNYAEVTKGCKEYVKINPNNFNNLKLYVQSLINDDKDFSSITKNKNTLVNEIAKYLYSILTEQESQKSLIALSNLNKRIYGLPIAAALHSFIGEQSYNIKRPLQAYYLCTTYDPIYSRIWESAHEKEFKDFSLLYINKGIEYGLDGLALQYYRSLYLDLEPPVGIAQYRIKRDNSIKFFKLENYENCISSCQSLLNSYPRSISICQVATEYSFMSYEKLGRDMDAITFYVNQYVERHSLTNKINLNKFVQKLRDNRYRRLRNNIDLLIFIMLNAEEDEQKAHVIEKYFDYKDISNAKDLIINMKTIKDQRKVELFLKLLIESDVMRHLDYIDSTAQTLDEKQVIINYLMSLDSNNHDYFVDLNNQLLELILLHNNTRRLDERKIYVNTEALLKYDLVEFENLYYQLLDIERITRSVKNISILDISDGSGLYSSDPNIIVTDIQTTNNASKNFAVQLFDSICNKFLFSKFGLKTYLSTRIRHGVLEGELRSVFDLHYLILLKERGLYRHIDYWQKTYDLEQSENAQLMRILEDFSKEIQNTIESFKENVVHIRTNDLEKGLFDYRIDDEIKCNHVFVSLYTTKDYQSFCRKFIKCLDILTESSLFDIRGYIKTELSTEFNTIINSLESNLKVFNSKHFYPFLLQAVNDSRADMTAKLFKIEKWFTLQSGKFEDFELDVLLKLVWKVTAKQYPHIKINSKFDIDDAKKIFKSRYYLLISDILTIIYNNIFTHGSPRPNNNVYISAKQIDENLLLHFENLTNRPDDELTEEAKKVIESDSYQSEGGSGLAKVKHIIRNELSGNSSDLNVQFKNKRCIVDLTLHLKKLLATDENSTS